MAKKKKKPNIKKVPKRTTGIAGAINRQRKYGKIGKKK